MSDSNEVTAPIFGPTMTSLDEFLEFRDLAEAVASYASYAATRTTYIEPFPFLSLPPEIRCQIIHQYLHLEREAGGMAKCLHYDEWRNACCVWYWPTNLIICDRHAATELPPPQFPPWLPSLAYGCKQMLGEVGVEMLKTTARFEFKYVWYREFRIVPWFMRFLASIPANEGFEAIREVNFPHGRYPFFPVSETLLMDSSALVQS